MKVGQFELDEKGVLSGPAAYMKEQGTAKLDRILAGNDAGFNAMTAVRPDIPVGQMVLVALQTDYAGWVGMRQMFGAARAR